MKSKITGSHKRRLATATQSTKNVFINLGQQELSQTAEVWLLLRLKINLTKRVGSKT
jgi:hypothetical protein